MTLPAAQYQLVQADADSALEIQAQRGVQGSIGAGPQRTETQLWDWNGAQYVKVKSEWSPVEYRIHAVYEGDDAFAAGDYAKATDWYTRVLTDDTLKDWLTEIGYANAHDRDTLQAYARFRLLLIGLLRGDANARDQLDQLTALYPEGSPVHLTQQMAQAFWDKYQETQDIKAACADRQCLCQFRRQRTIFDRRRSQSIRLHQSFLHLRRYVPDPMMSNQP